MSESDEPKRLNLKGRVDIPVAGTPSEPVTKQKKLMRFVTGSDGVPATGMSTLPFKLSLLGSSDSDKLPIAHTCFNELCLWQYRSKEKLESKLKWAVTESEGFGFK